MKIPRIFKLRKAIESLDLNFISKKIIQLEDQLTGQGKELEVDNTAITEEGIYYINPESGMSTKVVLYSPDQKLVLDGRPPKDFSKSGFTNPELISRLNAYHILRCNTLRNAEHQGWSGTNRIAQRPQGTFHYRILNKSKRVKNARDAVIEIENQALFICPNCLIKVQSLLAGEHEVERELFNLKYFFDIDFSLSWNRYSSRSSLDGSMATIYPKDWLEISRIRMEQVQHHCESCNLDLSHPKLRQYLYVHHTDYPKRKLCFVKLECLCIDCMADLPGRANLKTLPEYEEFLNGVNRDHLSLQSY